MVAANEPSPVEWIDAGPYRPLAAADVEAVYRRVLRRPADASALQAYVGRETSIAALVATLMNSEEYLRRFGPEAEAVQISPRPLKILLFGAYGNGNLGDALQASSLRNCIRRASPDVDVWATSRFGDPYDFPADRRLPPDAVYDKSTLQRFDALLIGGGGLLGHPHEPLEDKRWIDSLPIPFALVALGAGLDASFEARSLIARAAWASARDADSLRVMTAFRRDVHFMPDPILVDRDLDLASTNAPILYETCWILRGPLDENHVAAATCVGPRDVVVAIEPREDEVLRQLFPSMILIKSLEEFKALASKSRRIVSMRLHGLVLGLRLGRACYSICAPKGSALLDMLGLGAHAFDSVRALKFSDDYATPDIGARLSLFQTLFQCGLGSAFATIARAGADRAQAGATNRPRLGATREDVVYAYRYLLGREPESEAAVTTKLGVQDWLGLRDVFVRSGEYRLKAQAPSRSAIDALASAPSDVEVEISDEDFERLLARVQGAWEILGAQKPHWSVLTEQRFLPENIQDNLGAFHASGAISLDRLERAAARAGARLPADTEVFELGCGVGRVTAHLAKRFRRVIASDVSSAHLDMAREHLDQARNVRFVHVTDLERLAAAPVHDLFYSVIVLQHNPPPVMHRLLGTMLARLRPGGFAYFQVPVARLNYSFRVADYLKAAEKTPGSMEMHVLPQKFLFRLLDEQGFRLLDLQQDDSAGPEFLSLTVLAEKRTTLRASRVRALTRSLRSRAWPAPR